MYRQSQEFKNFHVNRYTIILTIAVERIHIKLTALLFFFIRS